MVRSASLMLGGILLLGGANLVHADGLYAPDASSDISVSPAMYGVFSRVPENWSDLPFQLKLRETAGYNSNVISTPQTSTGGVTVFGHPVGSLVSISDFGAATKAYWEGQQFFADGSIGIYRYFSDANLNSLSNSFDLGDNWTYGARCSGQLIASERTYPSEPGQQIGFNVKNRVTTISFNETGKCLATSNYALIFNSGVTRTTNSATGVNSLSSAVSEQLNSSNNNQSVFIAAGISYAVSNTNSLELLATVTGTNYTNRQVALTSQGLQNDIVENQINLTYTKNFSPNLALTASAGLVGVRNGSFSLEPARGFDPVYSAQVSWVATPKLTLSGTASRTVSPATSVLANLQVTESANFGLTYGLTPKVVFAANASASRSSGFNGSPNSLIVNPIDQQFAAPSTTYSANASVNYAITPFVTANLSYTHTRTVQADFVTPSDVVLLALTFNPY
jgi:hypothetical protein